MNFWGFDEDAKYKKLCLELMNRHLSKELNLPQPNGFLGILNLYRPDDSRLTSTMTFMITSMLVTNVGDEMCW